MKKIFILACTAAFVLSCNNKLEEEPRSILTPDFVTSPTGFRAMLDGAYAGTRLLWGQQDLFTLTVIGTDEFQTGQDGNNNVNLYSSGYTPSLGQTTAIWRNCYTYINACNAVIQKASEVNLDEGVKARMVAEAKYLRSSYYFVLAQFFGGVTLLTDFQTEATTSSTRHTLAETYNLIISDLNDAINAQVAATDGSLSSALPLTPKTAGVKAGEVTIIAAKHLLAKVYLTRAGSAAAQPTDFTMAHTIARDIVDNIAPANGMKLMTDFESVFAEGNEANDEVLWSSQHTAILAFNGSENQNNSGPDNMLHHFWVPQYEQQPGMQRSTLYGRPYIRCIPTRWMTDQAFPLATRVNDTRYNKTFQTVWYANNQLSLPTWNTDLIPNALPSGVDPSLLGKQKFQVGDTAIWMPGYQISGAVMDRTRYKIVCPSNVNSPHWKVLDKGVEKPLVYDGYSKRLSPAMKKFFDTKRVDMNAPSTRPVIVWRLADTYLMAAEALFRDGQAAAALPYINAIRRRAAYPTGNPSAMEITESQITLDFILDERSRELCGENMRWWDLVRTGKLLERVKLYNPEAKPNIVEKHILRPIPQAQIDAVITGDPYPQNPEW